MPRIIGSASVTISPDTSAFAQRLETQLNPIIDRISTRLGRQFGRTFAQVGAQASAALAQGFSQTAAPQMQAAATRATSTVARTVAPVMRQAGHESGQLFASGVGEGFAALAAFAIANRVRRFFTETITAATDFEQAFAGVRRVIDLTPQEFDRLSTSIRNMSEQLPFSATQIANVAAEAGRLGVAASNIAGFTETVLKFATATGQAPEQAAESLARFSTVTGESLSNADHLADVILKLGTASAASEEEILDFSRRLAPLAAQTAATSEDVLALATALAQAGVRSEAGGTAVVQTFNRMASAASQGGPLLQKFSEAAGHTAEEFADLIRTDPTQAFLDFLQGVRSAGTESQALLEELGLGSVRISIALRTVAASGDAVTQAIENSRSATGELDKQFSIFAATAAQRMEILKNRFENTRIEIGGKLAPVLVGLLAPIARLDTSTVSLVAAFAGVAAAGFGFIRLRNIMREFGNTFSGAQLTQEGFNLALQRSQATGESLSVVLRQLRQGTLVYQEAARGATSGTLALANAQAVAATRATTFRGIFSATLAEQNRILAANRAAALQASAVQQAFGASVASTAAQMGAFSTTGRVAATQLGRIAVAARTAVESVGVLSAGMKALTFISIGALGLDLLTQAAEAAGGALARLFNQIPAGTQQTQKLLLDLADGVISIQDALKGANISILPFLPTTDLKEARKEVENLDQALANIVRTSPEKAQEILDTLGFTPEQIKRLLDDYTEAALEAQNQSRSLGSESAGAAGAVGSVGAAAAAAAGGIDAYNASAAAAQGALAGLAAAQQQFQARVESFIPRFGEFIVDTSKAGAAANKAARDGLRSARAIADAQRALADARRDANRQIADAERKLADAQADALKRVEDAQRRLNEARGDNRRRVRDAQEELQDFEASLARVGGAQTQEDIIRLRELNEALTDTIADGRQAEADGQRELAEARAEGQQRVEDAIRKLAEVEADAADKIADALRRLARAHEDAANRSEAAAGRVTDSMVRTAEALTNTFRINANSLNKFADLIEHIAPRMVAAFGGDQDFSDAFLKRLADLGPAAIPLLRNIVKASDGELKNMANAFVKNIKAAKRAADFQFTRFPPNFEQAIRPAVQKIADGMQSAIGEFDALGDAAGPAAFQIGEDLDKLVGQLQIFAAAGKVNLTQVERDLLSLAESTTDPTTKINALKELLASLKSKKITVGADTKPAENAMEALFKGIDQTKFKLKVLGDGSLGVVVAPGFTAAAMGKTITGPLASIPRAASGFSAAANQPILVGNHTAEELFIPSTAGAIFRHTDTEKILRALKISRSGSVSQQIIVNEVASDPRATARAVSWAIGSGAVR